MICARCENEIWRDRKSTVMALCSFCFKTMNAVAHQSGYSLNDAPLLGQADERILMGYKLWFWRGTWRAEKHVPLTDPASLEVARG